MYLCMCISSKGRYLILYTDSGNIMEERGFKEPKKKLRASLETVHKAFSLVLVVIMENRRLLNN